MSSSVGLLAKKCGMTTFIADDGSHIPATVLYLGEQFIVDVKTVAKHGYNAIVVAIDVKRSKLLNKPQKVFFEKNNLPCLSKVKEFRLSEEIDLTSFSFKGKIEFDLSSLVNQIVDITSVAKGKGFAGVVKKYGFAGQLASHGESLSERSHGSTGQRQDPGKVFKGKKMAGRMGGGVVTTQNMKILSCFVDESLLIVNGSIPGSKGAIVEITSAVKSVKSRKKIYVFDGVKLVS